ADPAVILAAVYPKTIKTAAAAYDETVVSPQYDLAPDWLRTKAAEDRSLATVESPAVAERPRDPGRFLPRIIAGQEKLARERERLYSDCQRAWDKCASSFGALQLYFRA